MNILNEKKRRLSLFHDLNKVSKESFIYSNNKIHSYSELEKDSFMFKRCVTKRSLVFIIASNSYDCLTGYVGFLSSNVVVALISDTIHESMFDDLLKRFKPNLIYKPNNIICFNKNWKEIIKKGEYVLYETNYTIDYEINEDLSLLLMTSGSTGNPEFVRLSYANIYTNTKAICRYLNIVETDNAITTLPMSYSYGISVINTHLFMGASLIMTDSSVVQRSFWELFEKCKVTTFSGVPYTFSVLKKLKFENIDLSYIKYITQAGGKLSDSLLEYYFSICIKKKINFFVMYGQTEASPRMSYLPSHMLKNKLGSIGIPIPGGKLYLIDDSNKIINKPDVEGELVYEGKNVCLGYAKSCYDLDDADVNKGVLKTGDMAQVDSEGYFYITGRKKRFLKLFGNRVSLDQVELKINEAGYECACVGTDDKMEIYTTKKKNVENIYNLVTNYFDINRSGFSVICIDELPRNYSGKIHYSELEKNCYV